MRALDLFAGVGWGVACQRLGITEAGIEKMPESRATRAAADMITIASDVWEYDPATADFDGLIASPPCQTFSTAGKGTGRRALDDVMQAVYDNTYKSMDLLRELAAVVGDERTALALVPLHYWHVMRPQWVAFEQVSTVLPLWKACAGEMRRAGYSTWAGSLHAEQYGVPQSRRRAFLIAHRDREVGPPVPTHSRYYPRNPTKLDEGVEKWVSMSTALGWGLPERPSPTITGGGTETGGAEPIAHLARWTGRPDWVLRVGTRPCAKGRALGKPAPTLFFGQRSNYVAWERKEPLPDSVRVTVREAGILQSFPADFPWQGSKSKQFLQIGNAVPVLLAEHVLSAVTGIPIGA